MAQKRLISSNHVYYHEQDAEGKYIYFMPLLWDLTEENDIIRVEDVAYLQGDECNYYDIYSLNKYTSIGNENSFIHDKIIYGKQAFNQNGSTTTIYLPSGAFVEQYETSHYVYTTWYYWLCQPSGYYMYKNTIQEPKYVSRKWCQTCEVYDASYDMFQLSYPRIHGHMMHIKVTNYSQEVDPLDWRLWPQEGTKDFIYNTKQYYASLYWSSGPSNVEITEPPRAPMSFSSLNVAHRPPVGLESEVFRSALDTLRINTNNIQTCLEQVDLLYALLRARPNASLFFKNLKRQKSKLPKIAYDKAKGIAPDAWLKYRYAYSTSKADIEEIADFFSTPRSIPSPIQTIRAGGSGNGGTMRTKVVIDMSDTYRQLTLPQLGFNLDSYTLWDMVPYSFIIDWFVGIGDLLEDLESQQWALKAKIVSVTNSWSWDETIIRGGYAYTFSHYRRRVSATAPPFVPYSGDTSTTTTLKRVLDGVSLLIGGH